ncbi:MAG: GNAT family N-acetyltransferase, partial [Pseudonocardia sp.]
FFCRRPPPPQGAGAGGAVPGPATSLTRQETTAMSRTRTAPATARIVLRELRRDDAAVLDTVFAGLSPDSRYLRFHAPVPRLTAGLRRALLDVDGRDHIALVAEDDIGDPVGVARAVRDRTRRDEAELAVAVVDAWHRRGVGRRLVQAVADRAAGVGIRRLTARVLPENAAALGLFRSLFPLSRTRRDDDAVVVVALLGDAWDITMDDILADLVA